MYGVKIWSCYLRSSALLSLLVSVYHLYVASSVSPSMRTSLQSIQPTHNEKPCQQHFPEVFHMPNVHSTKGLITTCTTILISVFLALEMC